MTLWQCLMALGKDVPALLDANMALARWQLDWMALLAYPVATLPPSAGRVAGTMLAEFGLIAAYACLLARAA